jgi:hypothetical protein
MAKPFHIMLSDGERDRLESHRASRGLRSLADAVRDLILKTPVSREEFLEACGPESEPASLEVRPTIRVGVEPDTSVARTKLEIRGQLPVGQRKVRRQKDQMGRVVSEWIEVLVRYNGAQPVWEREMAESTGFE